MENEHNGPESIGDILRRMGFIPQEHIVQKPEMERVDVRALTPDEQEEFKSMIAHVRELNNRFNELKRDEKALDARRQLFWHKISKTFREFDENLAVSDSGDMLTTLRKKRKDT